MTNSKTIWDIATIQAGIERFIQEHDRQPTSQDFDETVYLPSARQIQRAHGGMAALRKTLGYGDMDFTKGALRQLIASNGNTRGIAAETYFEMLLIEHFGEAFVHTQKRYGVHSKNRYDFLIYAQGITFGIDIFTTDRKKYIASNIRHKIQRYKNAPHSLTIFFVLASTDYDRADVSAAIRSITDLERYPNLVPMCEVDFLERIATYQPLPRVPGLISMQGTAIDSSRAW